MFWSHVSMLRNVVVFEYGLTVVMVYLLGLALCFSYKVCIIWVCTLSKSDNSIKFVQIINDLQINFLYWNYSIKWIRNRFQYKRLRLTSPQYHAHFSNGDNSFHLYPISESFGGTKCSKVFGCSGQKNPRASALLMNEAGLRINKIKRQVLPYRLYNSW